MTRLWVFSLVTLLSTFSFAADNEKKFQLYDAKTKQYKTVVVVEKNDLMVSKDCFRKTKNVCLAVQAAKKRIDLTRSPTGVLGNPAARYCLNHSANNRILLDEKKREYDYCVFTDESMIDAWSLYNKHYGK